MTTPTVSPIFGPLIAPWNVEQAAVATLQKWLWPSYLEQVELQNGLAYGTVLKPASIQGAPDLDEWRQDETPAVMVVCEEPEGAPERDASIGYAQSYRLTVGVLVVGAEQSEEADARRDAGLYAAAIAGALGQQLASDHPTFISDIAESVSPSVAYADPDIRVEYLGQVQFEIYVCPMMFDDRGPGTPIASQAIPPDVPTVTQPPGLTITAVPLD